MSDWYFPCPDWAERIEAGEMPLDLDQFYPDLNEKRLEMGRRIFNNLILPDVPGQPAFEEAAGDWFKAIVDLAVGGLGEDGIQRVSTLLLAIPKKNSKTTNSAGLMLTLFLLSPRPRAEFVIVAPTHPIAEIAFKQMAGMIYADPALSERIHVREHLKRIEDRKSGCSIAVKTFDMQVATGSKAATILLDEAHLLTHPDAPRIIGQLRGGQAAISEGQMIIVTTMSDIPAAGYWKSELKKARNIRDGEAELAGYCPILYELPPIIAKDEKAVCDPENWRKVNPNLGRSVSMDWLQTSFKEAESVGRGEKLRWLSQHANVEITGYSLGDDAWGGALLWHKGARPDYNLERIILESDKIACGVDGGGMDDLMALCVMGRIDEVWVAWAHCWVAEVAMDRRLSIKSRLLDFEQQGDLTICSPGDDLVDIGEIVSRVYKAGKLAAVGIDPAGIGIEVADAVAAAGVYNDQVVNVPQGFKLNPSYTTLERRLEQGRFLHCDQQILAWCVSNAKRSPAGLVTKAVSGIGKIDALVATACAGMVMLEAPEPFSPEIFVV